MNYDKYFFTKIPKEYYYDFVSVGPNGNVPKRVRFSLMGDADVWIYSLSFGDVDKRSGSIDDTVKTNNADHQKVLTTVAAALQDFLNAYPRVYVVATGSTPSRNRLYQMGILSILEEINDRFIVFGRCAGQWEQFRKGVNYDAFMAKRKFDPYMPIYNNNSYL